MNKFKCFVLCLLFSFCCARVLANNIVHVITVGDTNDGKIGTSVKTDLRLFDKFVTDLRLVASSNGYLLKTYVLTGSNCSPSSVNNAINSLSANNDVVVFYYSGHGGRSHSDDVTCRFPRMCLGSLYADQWIKVSDGLNMLRAKGPKFVLMITDCCNSYYDRKGSTESAFLYRSSGNSEAFRKLFFESTGYASITGASPGEYGWCTQDGAYLTLSFLNLLGKAVSANDTSITWQQLMQSISDDTFKTTNEKYKRGWISSSQRPVFEVKLGLTNGGGSDSGGSNSDYDDPSTDNVPPVYDDPSTDNVSPVSDDLYDDSYDGDNDFVTNPERPIKTHFSIGNIFTFLISLLFGWLLIKKFPEFLNLEGILLLIVRIIGVIIVVRVLLTIFGM